MGLTRRGKCVCPKTWTYYVEFFVMDDGERLWLTNRKPGAKLKRWKVGCGNKTIARQHEAVIKTKLLAGAMVSERLARTVSTFGRWAKEYLQLEEVKRLRSYKERCQRVEQVLVPFFGRNTLLPSFERKACGGRNEAKPGQWRP